MLATLFWSGNFVVGRAVSGIFPPIGLAFWRWVLALALIIGFALPHLRRDRPVLLAHWREMVLLSVLGVATFNTLVYLGLRTTTVLNGVLMQSTMPLLILFGSYLLYRERIQSRQLAAVVLSLLGVAVIVAKGSLKVLQELSLNPGDGWIFLAVLSYAAYSVRLRKRPQMHPLSFVAITIAIGAAVLAPLALAESTQLRTPPLGPTAIAALAYVAVFPSLLAYLAFNRSVELIGANRAGQYLHLMPVFGSILAAVFLHERLQPFHAAGGLLIAAGIALANVKKPDAAIAARTGE